MNSKRNLGVDSSKSDQLKLALDQANEDLRQSLDNRRAVDTKIFGLTSLAIALISIIITVKPWTGKRAPSVGLFIIAFVLYAVMTTIGLVAYWPIESSTSNARAILEEKVEPYNSILQLVTESLLDFADENYEIAHRKTRMLLIMLIVFVVATAFLALGTLIL